MRSTRLTTRSLAVLLAAGVATLALAASATAVIFVYGNGFKSQGDAKEVKRSGGGNGCQKRFRSESKDLGVTVSGKRLCEFSPPVVGDAQQPNHVVFAKGRISKKTSKRHRKGAYFAVKVRARGDEFYELQVRPKGRKFKLRRSPSQGDVSESGKDRAIRGIKQPNALRLEIKNGRVTAFANGQKLISVVDPNPQQVSGRKVSFGIGNKKSGNVIGTFDRVRVGLAE